MLNNRRKVLSRQAIIFIKSNIKISTHPQKSINQCQFLTHTHSDLISEKQNIINHTKSNRILSIHVLGPTLTWAHLHRVRSIAWIERLKIDSTCGAQLVFTCFHNWNERQSGEAGQTSNQDWDGYDWNRTDKLPSFPSSRNGSRNSFIFLLKFNFLKFLIFNEYFFLKNLKLLSFY